MRTILIGILYCSFTLLCMGYNGIKRNNMGPTIDQKDNTHLETNLHKHIERLAGQIGIRNIENKKNYAKLGEAADYIEQTWQEMGYTPNVDVYTAAYNGQEYKVKNIEVVIEGVSPSNGYIVLGAHYDTVAVAPGADDNGTGIAALLEIARYMSNVDKGQIKQTIKLVAFPNEEAPYSLDPKTGAHFSNNMGSVVYAKKARKNHDIIEGMISLESIGYYSEEPGSQQYPWFAKFLKYCWSDKGDYALWVSNLSSKDFLNKCISAYKKEENPFLMHHIRLPQCIRDIGRSDHKSFWLEDYAAFMITDTANLRNPNYHHATDTVDTVNYPYFANITASLCSMVEHLALQK